MTNAQDLPMLIKEARFVHRGVSLLAQETFRKALSGSIFPEDDPRKIVGPTTHGRVCALLSLLDLGESTRLKHLIERAEGKATKSLQKEASRLKEAHLLIAAAAPQMLFAMIMCSGPFEDTRQEAWTTTLEGYTEARRLGIVRSNQGRFELFQARRSGTSKITVFILRKPGYLCEVDYASLYREHIRLPFHCPLL